ncbi:MAG: hypothetical protein L0K56_09465, partial [Corynebacterium sp.]|nr:hypothetical protein [Corynebacterium sp.]
AGVDGPALNPLRVSGPGYMREWADRHADAIAGEVLATSVTVVVDETLSHDVGDGVTAEVAKV